MIRLSKRLSLRVPVILSVALICSLAHAQTDLPPLKVVQLGDSYSAGNGARDANGNRNYHGVSGCYRSPTNWGSQFINSLADVFAVTYVNRACSSAVIEDILKSRVFDHPLRVGFPCPSPEYPGEESWLCISEEVKRVLRRQIDAVDSSVDLVLMTVGGNNLKFDVIVKQCFVTGHRDPESCKSAVEFANEELENNIEQRLIDTFKELRNRMRPDARIVYVTYPYLVPDIDYRVTQQQSGVPYDAGAEIRALGLKGDEVQRTAVAKVNADAGEEYVILYDGTKDLFEGHLPNPPPSDDDDLIDSITSDRWRNPNRWLYELFEFDLSKFTHYWYHYNPLGHQNLGNALSVYETFGAAGGIIDTKPDIDVAFIVDTTGSMGGEIAQTRADIAGLVAQLATSTNSFRVAIVSYRDYPSRTGNASDYPARVDQTFTDDLTAIQAAVDSLTASGGGDGPETVFSGINAAINLPWRPGVTKVAIVVGDAPALSPEPESDLTSEQIVANSIAIDPVQVFGINVGSLDSNGALSAISGGTGGTVVNGTANLTATISEILDLAVSQPYAWLGTAYSGKIGEPIQFDASGSYDPSGSSLALYEWDFNADGIFEFQSLEPVVSHTYDGEFNDFVVVRVTGSGGTALASARTVVNSQGFASQGDEEPCELDENGFSIIIDEEGQFIRCTADSLPTVDKEGVTVSSSISIPSQDQDSSNSRGGGGNIDPVTIFGGFLLLGWRFRRRTLQCLQRYR